MTVKHHNNIKASHERPLRVGGRQRNRKQARGIERWCERMMEEEKCEGGRMEEGLEINWRGRQWN